MQQPQAWSSSSRSLCLLVEDQAPSCDFLRASLNAAFTGIDVVTKTTRQDAMLWLDQRAGEKEKKSLGLALVDLGLPDGSGIEILQRLSQQEPETLSVVVTIHGDDAHLFAALAAGAYGYLLKEDDPNLLVGMLQRLHRQEPPLSPAIARRLLTHFRDPVPSTAPQDINLTARERETLTLIARGLTVPEAAAHLGLSAQTVASYVKIIYQKLHVSNRAQATREAMRRGLI